MESIARDKESTAGGDMNRYTANTELILRLHSLVEEHDDLRFSQILDVYGFVKPERPAREGSGIVWQNEFYLEPVELLKRVSNRMDGGNCE